SSRRRHTRFSRDWSSDVCSSDLIQALRLDKYSRDVQGIEISTTHSNYNKTRIIQGWRDLLNVPDPPNESGKFAEVRQMARDIIRSEERRVGKECRSQCADKQQSE